VRLLTRNGLDWSDRYPLIVGEDSSKLPAVRGEKTKPGSRLDRFKNLRI
jgi:hypothetical protein